MEQRIYYFLKEVFANPGITMKMLESKLNSTRSQLEYTLKKTNQWLTDKDLPSIKRKNKGLFCHIDIVNKIPELLEEESVFDHFLSEKERGYLILLTILVRQEELSLYHLSSALQVSKNTILADMKKIHQELGLFHVNIKFNRVKGYYLTGNELEKRKVLLFVLNKLLHHPNGESWINQIITIDASLLQSFIEHVHQIEAALEVQFSDAKILELPYIAYFSYIRSLQAKSLEVHDIEERFLIKETKEYQVTNAEFEGVMNETDILFFTVQMLSANVIDCYKDDRIDDDIYQAVEKMMNTFELLSCIQFQNRMDLLQKLYQHIRPAMFRIQYGVIEVNPLLAEVKKEHGDVHEFVKKSITPIELLLQRKMPEEELAYITMFMIGWMSKNGEYPQKRLKAVVVCTNGISVSRLLLINLKQLFPDIEFVNHLSVRGFYQSKEKFDLVFSTIPLETEKRIFVIQPFLTEKDKLMLQQNVNRSLRGYHVDQINYSQLLDIISRHAENINQRELKKDLEMYFSKTDVTTAQKRVELDLHELLVQRNIHIAKSVSSYSEAIWLVAKPLLEQDFIEERYIETIIQQFNPMEPYIVIAPYVAIPHASPEDGVNKLSMSLLSLKEPVLFTERHPVQLLVMIAASDYQSHLNALMQLNELLFDPHCVQQILNMNSPAMIAEFIKTTVQKIKEKEGMRL